MSLDLDEWRHAVHDLTETQRAINCGHHWRRGVCTECQDTIDWDDV